MPRRLKIGSSLEEIEMQKPTSKTFPAKKKKVGKEKKKKKQEMEGRVNLNND